jgi:hypothetical protein
LKSSAVGYEVGVFGNTTRKSPDMPSWNPGFSRLNACRDSLIRLMKVEK